MYHVKATIVTARRILQQLSHDPRSIALVFVAPCVLIGIFWWMFDDQQAVFNRIAPALLGVFPFVIMFLITSITTLRERSGGTLERLLVSPIGKLDIIFGYLIAFGLLGIVQAIVVSSVAIFFFDLDVAGPIWFMLLMAALDTVLGVALGLFVSAFARTEFQAVQFMPALVLPQFLVCGLILPIDQMPDVLQHVAHALPLTYAVDALQGVATDSSVTGDLWKDALIVGLCSIALATLGALTLKRRTA